MWFYVLEFFINGLGTRLPKKCHYLAYYPLSLAIFFYVGCRGLYLLGQEQYKDIYPDCNEFYEEVRDLVLYRFYFWAIVLLLICAQYTAIYCAESDSTVLDRFPVVKDLIRSKATEFKNLDSEVEDCSICLEKFNETPEQQVAQLNCSDFHIFHVDCIESWIEKNDICPLCK